MFARDSVATRHIIMFMEKPPEAMLETVRAAEVARGAATRLAACAAEMSTSEVTHLFKLWSGMNPEGQNSRQ